MVSFQVVVLAAVALINIVIVTLLVTQGWKAIANRYFGVSAFFVVLWVLGTALFYAAPTQELAEVGLLLFYVAPMFTVLFLSLFATIFRSNRRNPFDLLNSCLLLMTILGAVSIMFSPVSLTKEITLTPVGNVLTVDTAWYALYVLYFNIAFCIAFAKLFLGVRSHRGVERQQFIFIFIGTFGTALLSLITNLMLPLYGNTSLIWLGPTWSLLYVAAVSISIAKHGLFDIRQTVVRTVAYVLSLTILALVYYALAYTVSLIFFRGEMSAAVSLSPVNIAIALILAFLFQPIKVFFDKVTDRVFFRDRYDTDEFYTRLNEVVTSTTELRGLLQRVSEEIGGTLKAEQAFFFVSYGDHHVSAGTARHTQLPVGDVVLLDDYVTRERERIVVTELLPDSHAIHRLLVSHRVAICMPLMRKNAILGYLLLGDSRANGYTKRDTKVLMTIADELVIAIQNALSVQEIKEINLHLQQRIEAATKELKASNSQLRHLDSTKDEFLSMASHQLRTPLTSVKGYISMVLEGDTGKITEAQRHLLTEAFVSSERMVHLIHDFLNVSRLQTGKFMLEQHPTDLSKLVAGEVKSLQRVAESRGLIIKYVPKGVLPILLIDENKMQQVVMNYIDNALYYSRDETKPVLVTLELVGESVELRVVDSGIGVPKSEQAQLFSKFYRASNARKKRPDGTGVGIYLAKKVITAHGGEVIFESREGKGSTFGFRLPLAELQVTSGK